MSRVKINLTQIERVSDRLKGLKIKESHRNRDFITFNADRKEKIMAYLLCTAICHQTYTLVNKDKNLVGWNYLEYVFSNLAKSNSRLLDIEYINSKSDSQLTSEIEKLFPEGNKNSQCTLDKLSERVILIKDIGETLKNKYNSNIENLIEEIEIRLSNKGKGIYELLNDFKAFQDPLKKKSTLLIKLLYQSDLINIYNFKDFKPLMDYHMQRLLLRSSCIDILDVKLESDLKNKRYLDSDMEIREKCVEAIRIISSSSGISILDLDDIFWALGRSCCNDKILCKDGQCSKEPCTLTTVIDLKSHEKCLLEGSCMGSLNENYLDFWQPQVRTNFY